MTDQPVLNNLVINATHAMKGGGVIRIQAKNVTAETEKAPVKRGKHVKITVEDEGVGIPKTNFTKIFDLFLPPRKPEADSVLPAPTLS